MTNMTQRDTKTHWFHGHKDYWTGIGVIIIFHSIIYGAAVLGRSLVLLMPGTVASN